MPRPAPKPEPTPPPRHDEPRRHPVYLAILAASALLTVPFPFVGEPVIRFGLPTWLWWSLGWTAVLALVTAWGIVRYWRDDDLG